MSPDGKTMASAGTDNLIKLWDLGSGSLIKSMAGHEANIYSLTFSRNGEILASGGDDDSVRIWSVKDASTVSMEPVVAAAAAATVEQKTKTTCLRNFATKRTPIYSVSFTSQNVLLALGVYQK